MRPKKRLIIAVSARTPRSASNRSQSACKVMSDFSALSASRNSRCGSSLGRRYPPILLAAREPLRSKRCTHLIAEDSLPQSGMARELATWHAATANAAAIVRLASAGAP